MASFREDDILNRSRFARKIVRLCENYESYSDHEGLVIALDSQWGTGKSTFVKKFKSLIDEDYSGDFSGFIYDSWKDDGFSYPLIPIMNALVESFSDEFVNAETKRELIKTASKLGKIIAKGIGKKIIVEKMNIDLNEVQSVIEKDLFVQFSDIEGALRKSEDVSAQIDYKEYVFVRNQLKNLISNITLDKKFIFVIDELDRCRPTYAIEVLESIKHYFDIKNVIFIVSLDIDQLSHSIATIYGQNMDSRGYLLRFFNLHIKIPEPSLNDFISLNFNRYNINSYGKLNDVFKNLFEKLNCSLRDIERVILNYKILCDTAFEDDISLNQKELFAYFLILKYKYPPIFEMVVRNFFLEHNNSTNVEFKVIPDKFYKVSDTIKYLLEEFKGGKNAQPISRSSKVLLMGDTGVFDSNISLGKYIENKLEMFVGEDF